MPLAPPSFEAEVRSIPEVRVYQETQAAEVRTPNPPTPLRSARLSQRSRNMAAQGGKRLCGGCLCVHVKGYLVMSAQMFAGSGVSE